jgi:hypothetical protein
MPNLLWNLIRKEPSTSQAELTKPSSHGLVELSEAETDKVSGGDSSHIHVNNVRIANNSNITNSPGVISLGNVTPTP